MSALLRIAQIEYLNVQPLFVHLRRLFPAAKGAEYTCGTPAHINAAMAQGCVDMAPASAFEYLRSAEQYCLLPDLAITAPHGPVTSVLLLSPVPLEDLARWMKDNGPQVQVTRASASSVALLKILWKEYWKLPEAIWEPVVPGSGLEQTRPFLEIGDAALRHHTVPPAGWHQIDLGQAWYEYTGLPFVFGVWIVRQELARDTRVLAVHSALMECKKNSPRELAALVEQTDRPSWLCSQALAQYFTQVGYDFGPQEQASFVLFGDACQRMGLIQATPQLVWAG